MRILAFALALRLARRAGRRAAAGPAAPARARPAHPVARGAVSRDELRDAGAGDARLITAANAYPLGTIENPVRVGGPEGERAYLARLTCEGGAPLRIGTRSEAGEGGFGAIVNAYAVACGGTTRRIVFDMYHAEHVENRAPAGFAIRP